MKICLYGYTIGTQGSGARQYATDLGKWLLKDGHDVTLVTGKWGDRSAASNGLKTDYIASRNSPVARTTQIDFALHSISYFRRHRRDFDLIHSVASFPQFIPLVIWVKRLTGLPVIHTLLAPCAPRPSFDSLDGLICVSRGIEEKIQSSHAWYLPPFIDLEPFAHASPYDLGYPDEVLIGTMGAPFHRKGVRYLVEAIPIVLKHYPGVHFFLAVDLPGIQFMKETREERDYINRFIHEHQLRKKVDVLGHVDVPRFLKSLNLFVYAVQTTRGMIDIPPTLLECLAAGCGVVTSREGGISELIQDRHNGLLVEQRDRHRPEAYAEKIIELLRDRSLLDRIRENGPSSVGQFELNRVGQGIVQCYEKVLANREAGA
jgi:glycosyltransferase involved in cell wall biosynthesis